MTILAPLNNKAKPKRRTYLDNRATSAHRRSKTQQKSYSQRLTDKHETKLRVVSMLEKLGEFALADRMKVCGSKFTTITCGTHIIGRKPHEKCNSRFCPFCAARRARKFVEQYAPKAAAFVSRSSAPVTPVHLVLTLSHKRGETAKQARQRLLDAFKKLTRRQFWDSHFLGGLYSVEFTLADDGCWHCHAHIIAFRRRFFDVSLLRAEWLAVTGDSVNLRLDRITDLRAGLLEAVKYATKPLDARKFELSHLKQLLALKGCRMTGAFGEFATFCRDYEPTDAETADATDRHTPRCAGELCPQCGETLFELVLTVGELTEFARRIEGVPLPRGTPTKGNYDLRAFDR